MKKLPFQLIWINLFFAISISSAHADKLTATEIKILPYIEAEGELDSMDGDAILTWVSPNKVLFGTSGNSGFSDPSCNTKNPRLECRKPTFDRTKIFMVFDISNKKTTFNIKNEFYDKQLELFNQQRYWDTDGCPNLGKEGRVGYRPLRESDGCIKEVTSDKADHVRKFSYVQPNGKSFDLIESSSIYEFRFWSWIDWLKVYLFRTDLSPSTTSEVNQSYVRSTSSVVLLSPISGKFKFVEVGANDFSGATITRAGLMVYLDSNVNTKLDPEKQGLTLIQGNKRYLIAKEKSINITAGSPDGCHVAYLSPRRVNEMRSGYLADVIYHKLRVIDICEGFAIARDANPFANLL